MSEKEFSAPDSGAADSWRPVVVGPHPHQLKFSRSELARMRKWSGSVIRVRPQAPDERILKMQCDGQTYLVHPDDVAKIYGCPARSEMFVCEHMIQAD